MCATKSGSFEKGSVESTHKVPNSHYRTKHCHAAVAPSFEKGSVESTHRQATTGTTRNTATQRSCQVLRKGQLNRHTRYRPAKFWDFKSFAKGSVDYLVYLNLFSTSHWLEMKLRLIIFTHDQHETRRHVAPQPFLTSSRLTCSRIQLQTDQIMLSEPGAPVAFCNSKQITRVQCRAALALVCPRRV